MTVRILEVINALINYHRKAIVWFYNLNRFMSTAKQLFKLTVQRKPLAYNPGKLILGAGAVVSYLYFNWMSEKVDLSQKLAHVQ